MFNSNSRPWKCKRTAFELILVENVSFHFLAKGCRRGPAKSSEKSIFGKSTNFMFICKSRPWKCKRTALRKNLKKKIFWKSTNFMFSSNSRPWKCKRTEFESIFVEKVSFRFLASRPQGQTCEKVWQRYILKIQQFYVQWQQQALKIQENRIRIDFGWKSFLSFFGSKGQDLRKGLKKIYFENPPILCSIATAGPENAREQNSNWFWLKKFHFIFWPQGHRWGPVKSSERNIFWKSTNFMFICKSRPWKCETNSIRIDFGWKTFISFFGLRPQVRTCEKVWKNIFWKSTNFMFNSNSRPWKCRWTAFESILAEKISFHFLASGRRRGPVKSCEKNIFWKSTNFMFNSNSRPWKCKRTAFESILAEKVSFHFLASGRRRGPVKTSEKNIFWKSTNFMFNSNSRPWKCKRTEFELILVEKVSFHFLAQGRRRRPAKSSEKNIFWKSTNFMFNSNSRPWKCKRTEFESILVEKVSFHFLASRPQARTCEKFWKKYILKIHKFYVHLQKQALKMQTNSIRINFGWKSFISFFGLRPQARTCEKVLKKIYFENPPILCSIATAGHENANENSNSNWFWLKKFRFIFWPQGRRRWPAKKFWKKYILKIHQFYVHLQKQALKMQDEQHSNQFWLKKFQGHRHGPVKSSFFGNQENANAGIDGLHFFAPVKKSEKIYFENPPILCSIATEGLENAREQNSSQLWLHKDFLAQARRRGPVQSSEKNIFWKSTNFMLICNKQALKMQDEQNSNRFWLKRVSFHFLASKPQARTCEKFWKKYILKIHKFYVHLQKQALKMQTNSIRINFGWKSFISFFGLRPAGVDLQKVMKKIYLENPSIICS